MDLHLLTGNALRSIDYGVLRAEGHQVALKNADSAEFLRSRTILALISPYSALMLKAMRYEDDSLDFPVLSLIIQLP